MDERYREFRTGQGVPKEGTYICQSGEKAKLSEQDEFPVCPISGNETYWKHDGE
ncbi:hypothetical protein [Lentibacillus cibarius]|uniref:hypothetical protein n=1 Tax=Lentibacillus cibarius TaxID=2583219 RepID=UPI00163D7DF7|nr:hypothetical protein [Lentibacillus cibarius]